MESDPNKESSSSQSNESNLDSSHASKPLNIPSSSRSGPVIPGSPLGSFPSFLAESPPSFVSIEEILKIAEDVSNSEINMALAHEIAVNNEFRFQPNEDSIYKQVKEICHKAFWDVLAEKLSSNPPDHSQALVLLAEIKDNLLRLLPPYSLGMRNEINEVLDLPLIEQQTQKGTINFMGYAQFILSVMARMCAKTRDAKIQELRELTEIVPLYKGIFETLDLMKLDMVNFTIANVRPKIRQHSVEYEKAKFKEILDSLSGLTPPIDGLKFTHLWLQEVYQEAVANLEADTPSNALVLRKAFIKLLAWKETDKFPETLHLDHGRFISLQDNLFVMVLTATVLLVTYSNVGPSIQGISAFKEKLKKQAQVLLADSPQCKGKDSLEQKMNAVALQVVKEVNACLEQHGFPVLNKEKEEEIIQAISKTSDENHHVRKLIMRRSLEFLELALHSSSKLQVPPGLSTLQDELSSFAGQFMSLVRHNQDVFSDYYNDFINQCKGCQ